MFMKKFLHRTNLSSEVFKVNKTFITNPVTHQLKDLNGHHIIRGGFNKDELCNTKTPKTYLI